MLIATALGIAALLLLTPMGGSVEAIPLLGMLITVTLGTAAGFAYTGRLMKNSVDIYTQWQ